MATVFYLGRVNRPLLILLLTLLACESVPSASPPEGLPDLRERFAQGQPVPANRLETWLEGLCPPGMVLREAWAREVNLEGVRLCEGQMVATSEQGYLAVIASDLAADSSAYLHLYRRYLAEAPAEPDPQLSWARHNGGFAWIWRETGTDIHYLEAGMHDRLHLRVRSNLPGAPALIRQVAANADWASWRKFAGLE